MSNHLVVKITVPSEYDNKTATPKQIAGEVAKLFPHDPRLESVLRHGGTVDISIEGPKLQKQPNIPETEKEEKKPEDTKNKTPAP